MRKTRSTGTRRRTTRRTTSRKKSNPILLFDILGVALIFLCPISLVALAAGDSSGFLGRYVAAALHVTVGVGAYVIPFLMAVVGVVFIVGPLKSIPRNIAIGSSILFLVIVTWASHTRTIEHGAIGTGGYLGDALASVLRKAGGYVIGRFILAALAVIGTIIIVDVPLANLIDKAQSAFRSWKEEAHRRAAERQEIRAKQTELKSRTKEATDEGRKRTLARIFSRDEDKPREKRVPITQAAERATTRTLPILNEEPPGNGGNGAAAEQGEFQLPPTSLLTEPPPPPPRVESELHGNIEIIERTLEEFKVVAEVVEIAHGPTVTRYEVRLAPGIKVNKIVGLADNLAMQLSAIDVRVEAPIPGKSAIGVEVPNKNRGIVVLREVVESKAFQENTSKLAFALGKDVAGRSMVADLAKMPHMLIGGATNAGKSVCLNSLIASLLFRATPDELKLILIDPKRVELSLFDCIPHLACPVVKNVSQAAGTFRAVVQEMERRYDLFARIGARNLDGYNERVEARERLPYIVVVVDELCDLMMQAAAEVEGSITRLAQLARATGIHLVIATQRPSVDVITGVIKANISSRIAFAVSSHHDSRTILDHKGAERLIGSGDMLFLPIDASKPTRIQGCYLSEKEIERVCDFLKEQRKPMYTIQPTAVGAGGGGVSAEADDALADEFYEPSVRFIVNTGYCSTSMLQRKFKIGYTRAARIVDVMEEQGIVGPLDGAKPRQVLVSKADLASLLGGPIGMRPDDDEEYDEDVPPAEIIEPDEEEEF